MVKTFREQRGDYNHIGDFIMPLSHFGRLSYSSEKPFEVGG
jgi:hypothetical protein